MKLEKQLYNILQYLSTIEDVFAYNANQVLVAKNRIGSDFAEVDVPNFFKKPFVIKSLSKFLRLFTFDRGKNATNESIQDWTFSEVTNSTNNSMGIMYINSPGKTVKLQQGAPKFIEIRKEYLKPRFDNIIIKNTVKFQITQQLYKQILSDCSLLDLDTITICSENEHTIRIYLTKKDSGCKEDYSSYTVDCDHEHVSTRISFSLSSFNLIEATDHQLEWGTWVAPNGYENMLLKVRSFCDNNYIVKKLIVGLTGVKL